MRAGDGFAAHEVLEDLWRAAPAAERDLYQGLVHVAVATYQESRGNEVGRRRQLEKARRRLGPYAPAYEGLDVAALLRWCDAALAVGAVPTAAARVSVRAHRTRPASPKRGERPAVVRSLGRRSRGFASGGGRPDAVGFGQTCSCFRRRSARRWTSFQRPLPKRPESSSPRSASCRISRASATSRVRIAASVSSVAAFFRSP